MEKDPVCGMSVARETARFKFDHGGKTYFFCCQNCLEKFKTDPAKYMSHA